MDKTDIELNEIDNNNYKTLESAIADLLHVENVDMSSDKTKIKDAMPQVIKVMSILGKLPCDEIKTKVDVKLISLSLQYIGCTSWRKLSPSLKNNLITSFDEMVNMNNSVDYPAYLYGQIIGKKDADKVREILKYAQESCIGTWLDNQLRYEKENLAQQIEENSFNM